MRHLAEKIANVCDVMVKDNTGDRAVLATVSGVVIAAAITQGSEMSVITAVEAATAYTAYRIVPIIAKKISRFIRGEDVIPRLPRAVLDHIGDLKGLETVAIAARDGKWLVTEPGNRNIQVMNEYEFSLFSLRVAMEGGVLNKVTVDEDAVRITRHEAGLLNGITEDLPAIMTVHYSGKINKVYSENGRMLATPQVRGPDIFVDSNSLSY